MIAHVYKPRRYDTDGKIILSRLYRGRIRLEGEYKVLDVGLKTTDKQVAEKMLADRIRELERERAGLIAPRLERESAQQPLSKHQDDFVADLVALGRTKKYSKLVMARFTRLAAECKWRMPGDITTNSFVSWRAQQTKLSPKTLNEYLNAANALLNWMVKQGRVSENPLRGMAHADVRGHTMHRRAYTGEELDRLLAVAEPEIRLLYLAAALTGLRAGELKQVIWGDIHLDCERPHICVRASTAKNRKDATLPLHPQLVAELSAIRKPTTKPESRAFSQHPHPDRQIRADLEKAGIPRIDSTGRKLDFHALRYTFATRLAACGVSQRLAQELMRHSDPRLTANIYTDATQLPTFEAIQVIPWQGENAANPAKNAEKSTLKNTHKYTHNHTVISSQTGFSTNLLQTQTVSVIESINPAQAASELGYGHLLTTFVRNSDYQELERATGLEGQTKNPQRIGNQYINPSVPVAGTAKSLQGNFANNKKLVEVAGVEIALSTFAIC
jgi:integrase